MAVGRPIPVILDTDIGSDFDDTWALGMMLKSPELDIQLIVSCTNDTVYRAKIIAKILERAGRSDIPVGIGIRQNEKIERQAPWVADYDLSKYPVVHRDGVAAIVETIMNSKETVTLISIGPVSNIAKALEIEPRIASKTRFVGMHGSVHKGYNGAVGTRDKEYNVVFDIPACQKVFTAPWKEITVTPVDTCGRVRLEGERYQKMLQSKDVVIMTIMENYKIWAEEGGQAQSYNTHTNVLFDNVAVYLAFSQEELVMKREGIRVTDDGFTVPDETAQQMNVAVEWKSLERYMEFLTNRLLSPVVR